jgi:hypothetical protein
LANVALVAEAVEEAIAAEIERRSAGLADVLTRPDGMGTEFAVTAVRGVAARPRPVVARLHAPAIPRGKADGAVGEAVHDAGLDCPGLRRRADLDHSRG